jgi:hypothetical protein
MLSRIDMTRRLSVGPDLSEYDHEKWHREEESVPLANLCRYPD